MTLCSGPRKGMTSPGLQTQFKDRTRNQCPIFILNSYYIPTKYALDLNFVLHMLYLHN